MNVAEQVEAIRARYRHAITETQAVVLLAADRDGSPLDPFDPGDAAVLLHSEGLVVAGRPIRDAIQAGRGALRASRAVREHPGHVHELPSAPMPEPTAEPTKDTPAYQMSYVLQLLEAWEETLRRDNAENRLAYDTDEAIRADDQAWFVRARYAIGCVQQRLETLVKIIEDPVERERRYGMINETDDPEWSRHRPRRSRVRQERLAGAETGRGLPDRERGA
jgi:hypothetical protein